MFKRAASFHLFVLILFLLSNTSHAQDTGIYSTKKKNPLKQHKPNFTESYQEKFQDQVTVEIPEMFELAHVIIALMDEESRAPGVIDTRGSIYQEVISHFSQYRDHRLFSELQLKGGYDYYCFVNNSFRYVFQKDKIVWDGVHPVNWGRDRFYPQRKLIEDFARKSKFREFFADHSQHYADVITEYKRELEITPMVQWLEDQFTITYDSYRVVISPLVGGSHSTNRVPGKDFSEILMFVAAFHNYSTVSENVNRALQARVVFTEINHNYVNPVSKIFKKYVNRGLSDKKMWSQNRSGMYKSHYALFNEYMTWGVFLLYAFEHYTANVYTEVVSLVTSVMIDKRKFPLFGRFYTALFDLYSDRDGSLIVRDLYPGILKWCETMN